MKKLLVLCKSTVYHFLLRIKFSTRRWKLHLYSRRKIDSEMNMQDWGYSAKLRNGDGGNWCSMADGNRSCQTRASVFRTDDMLRTTKTLPEMTRQPYWSIEILQILRMPSDFTFKSSQLMLRGWWRLPEIAQKAHSRHQKHRRWWPGNLKDRSKLCNYQHLFLQDQARPLEKHQCAAWTLPLRCHCKLFFFSTITRNSFCSHLRKIISRRPWPHQKKTKYTYGRIFL